MPGPAAILRDLHRLERHAADLQAQIERAPNALKVQQARVTRAEDTHKEAQEAIKRYKIAIHEKEVSLRAKNQQIAKHQKQLNEATSKKEYDALQAEITAEKQACRALEDDILNDMLATEEKTAQLPQLDNAVKQARDELNQFEIGSQARLDELNVLLEDAKKNLRELAATLPEDIVPHDERLRAAKGEDAMSAVHNRTCSSCYTEITAQNYNELTQDRFVLCKNCGRILYLTDN